MKVWKLIKRIPVAVMVFIIRGYQVTLSPHIPGCCRFQPTCSQYSLEAFKKHGFCKGLLLTVKRIARCRPGGGYGYDPVP